jgi:CheY-like chemotaxis protein
MLSGISGLDVCREIRGRSREPIIMITAKSSGVDAVVGFERVPLPVTDACCPSVLETPLSEHDAATSRAGHLTETRTAPARSIATAVPRRWTDEIVGAADVVVTMGCGDTCPYVAGKRYEDWQLEDPAGLGVDAVRPIRDDIERRVRRLLASLDLPER